MTSCLCVVLASALCWLGNFVVCVSNFCFCVSNVINLQTRFPHFWNDCLLQRHVAKLMQKKLALFCVYLLGLCWWFFVVFPSLHCSCFFSFLSIVVLSCFCLLILLPVRCFSCLLFLRAVCLRHSTCGPKSTALFVLTETNKKIHVNCKHHQSMSTFYTHVSPGWAKCSCW